MNDLDSIFKRLDKHQVKSPDVWSSIGPNIGKDANKTISNKIGRNAYWKTLSIISVISFLGLGTYILLDKERKEELILKNPSISIEEKLIESKKIQKGKNKIENIDKANDIIVEKKKDLVLEYNNIIDEDLAQKKIDSKEYSISPIKINNIISINAPKQNETNISVENKNTQLEDEALATKKNDTENDSPKIEIPNFISPNGDGINDVFIIKNLENYPNNSIIIFNERNKIVYRSKCYKNNFNGTNLPSGRYFYILEYNFLGEIKQLTGFLEIRR